MTKSELLTVLCEKPLTAVDRQAIYELLPRATKPLGLLLCLVLLLDKERRKAACSKAVSKKVSKPASVERPGLGF